MDEPCAKPHTRTDSGQLAHAGAHPSPRHPTAPAHVRVAHLVRAHDAIAVYSSDDHPHGCSAWSQDLQAQMVPASFLQGKSRQV